MEIISIEFSDKHITLYTDTNLTFLVSFDGVIERVYDTVMQEDYALSDIYITDIVIVSKRALKEIRAKTENPNWIWGPLYIPKEIVSEISNIVKDYFTRVPQDGHTLWKSYDGKVSIVYDHAKNHLSFGFYLDSKEAMLVEVENVRVNNIRELIGTCLTSLEDKVKTYYMDSMGKLSYLKGLILQSK